MIAMTDLTPWTRRCLRAYLSPGAGIIPETAFQDWLAALLPMLGLSQTRVEDVIELFETSYYRYRPHDFEHRLSHFDHNLTEYLGDDDAGVSLFVQAQRAKLGALRGLVQLCRALKSPWPWLDEPQRLRLSRAWGRQLLRRMGPAQSSDNAAKNDLVGALLLLIDHAQPTDIRRYLAQINLLIPKLHVELDAALIAEFEAAAKAHGLLRVSVLCPGAPADDKLNTKHQLREILLSLSRPLPLQALPDHALKVATRLRARFPWAEDVLKAMEDDLLVAETYGKGILRMTPLLLVGPPGGGKSSLLNQFAREVGLPFAMVSAAGALGPRLLVGTTRGWASASPCLPVELIARYQVANPMLFVDELDKEGATQLYGRLSDALLSFLEPENAKRYFDEGLMTAVDLRWFNWAAACNDPNPIPDPVRSRFREIQMGLPRPEHGPLVAQAVIEELRAHYQLPPQEVLIDEESWYELRRLFDREPSARDIALATRGAFSATLRRRVRLAAAKAAPVQEPEGPDHVIG